MKYPISRYLLSIAMGAAVFVGFTACSDEKSDNPVKPDQPQVIDDSHFVAPTPESPIVTIAMGVNGNGDKTKFVISGGARLDLLDTTTIPSDADVQFYDMSLEIFKVNAATGGLETTPLTVTFNKPTTTIPNVNWSDFGASIFDENKSDCGTFRIRATYMASYDPNVPALWVSVDSVEFTRDESFCKPIEEIQAQTPVEVPGSTVELTMFTVDVGTKDGTGISLASGTAVPLESADLYFTADELTGTVTAHTANGVQIAEYTNARDKNYEDDWTSIDLPPDPHMSDFKFKEKSLGPSISGIDKFSFYVATTPSYNATTGDGFYAFTIQTKSDTPDSNNNYALTILVFKKK